MRASLYEYAGGGEALLRLAQAHHVRCLADPELNHPFSHEGQHPQHVERLALYWGEVLGGPAEYSQSCGTQTDLLTMHSGNGDLSDLNRRFVDCFVAAADDAGLPADAEFRAALRAYMEWAVDEFNAHPEQDAAVPSGLFVPRWDWDGLDVTGDPFPEVRWGSESSRLRRPADKLAATCLGSWLVRTATPLERRLLRRSRGRLTVLGPIGAPTLLLTTTGAKSGQPRTSPLLYVRDPGRLYVVGSNFGQAQHPAWSSNLLADPHATVTMGGKDVAVTARRLEGEERDRIWARFVALATTYDAYRQRTDRDIRLFALDPV